MQGSGKADWQEVFSDGTDPPALAGTREDLGNKKSFELSFCSIAHPLAYTSIVSFKAQLAASFLED